MHVGNRAGIGADQESGRPLISTVQVGNVD